MTEVRRDDRSMDEAFSRFVRERDGDALGEVFDRAAPRLLLVAVRLVGDRDGAEDLVQQVFLEAVRGADRFQVGAPVMPWLWTILTRRAERVRNRVRSRIGDIDFVDVMAPGEGPEATAMSRELVDQIASAVESLPKPYREVVALRLLHELEPPAIANALDRPLATVHTQLRRGLERLKPRLPAGIASFLVVAFGVEAGIAQLRMQVLTQAASVTAASVPASVGASAYLSVTALKVAFLLAAVVGVAVVGLGTWGDRKSEARLGSGEELVAVGDTDSKAIVKDVDLGVVRESAGGGHGGPSSEATPKGGDVSIVARVSTAADDAPLANVRLALEPVDEPLAQPAHGFSGDEGRVRAKVKGAERGYRVLIEHPDFVGWRGLLRGPILSGSIDLGRVSMHRGAKVRLRVVDPLGHPYEGYGLKLAAATELATAGPFALVAEGAGEALLTGDGGLTDSLTLRPGVYDLRYFAAKGVQLPNHGTHRVLVPLHGVGRDLVFDVVVDRADPVRSVSGFVRDLRGRPVEARVIAPEAQISTRCHPDGRFLVPALAPGAEYSLELLDDKWRRYTVVAPSGPVATGSHGVEFVVDLSSESSLSRQRLLVLGPNGESIERAAVQIYKLLVDGGRTGWPFASSAQNSPEGGFEFEAEAGVYVAFVRPGDPSVPAQFVEFEVPARAGFSELRLREGTDVQVYVVDRSRQPVSSAKVESWWFLEGGDRMGQHRAHLLSQQGGVRDELETGGQKVLLTKSITDDSGYATLRLPPGRQMLLASHEVLIDAPRSIDVRPGGHAVEVVCERGALVDGRVSGAEAWQGDGEALQVRLSGVDGWVRRASVDASGRFRFASLPPGSYGLSLSVSPFGVWWSGPWSVTGLRSGECRTVAVDLRSFAPASVSFEVPPGVIGLRLWGEDQTACEVDVQLDGSYYAPRVPPGEYLAWMRLESRTRDGRGAFSPTRIVVRAGRDVYQRLAMPEASAVLRVEEANGSAAGLQAVYIVALGLDGQAVSKLRYEADADGVVDLDPVPSQRFRVEVRRGWKSLTLATLEVPVSGMLQATVRLPH